MEEMSENEEISPKRPCHMETPEAFRRESVPSSTPGKRKSCAKKLYSDDNETSFVTIKNIPHPFMELTFINFLEKLIRRNHIVNEEDYPSRALAVKADEPSKQKPDKAVIPKIVLSCTPNENNVIVELPSKEIAAGLVKLVTAKYLRRTLVFEPVVHSEEDDSEMYDMSTLNDSIDFIDNVDTVKDSERDVTDDVNVATNSTLDINANVNVSHYYVFVDNVPQYNQKYLKFALNDILLDGGCANETNCIISVMPVGEEIMKVELTDEKCAHHLLSLKSNDFLDSTINFKSVLPTPVPSEKSIVTQEEEQLNNNEIYVVDLPEKYNVTLLKFSVNDLLWDASCTEKDTNGILSCTQVGEGVVKLELVNERCSEHLKLVESCNFGNTTIGFKTRLPDPVSSEDSLPSHEDEKLNTNEIYVVDLPEKYNTLLKFSVNDVLWDASCTEKDTNGIFSCTQVGEGIVKLELVNEKYAKHLKHIESLAFGESEILFCKTRDITVNEIINVPSLGDCTSTAQKKNASYLLTNDGKTLFLKLLVATRDLFKTKKNYQVGYARIMAELAKDGIQVDLHELATRRKYWLDIYNKLLIGGSTTNEMYRKPLSVIFGGAPVETVAETSYQTNVVDTTDEAKVAATAALFTKGAVWTTAALKYLLRVVRNNIEILQNSKRQDLFWVEVSNLLKLKGHHYEGPSCGSKFDEAKRLYRNEQQRMQRTGERGAEFVHGNRELWYWNENMHFMMEKDVSHRALCPGEHPIS